MLKFKVMKKITNFLKREEFLKILDTYIKSSLQNTIFLIYLDIDDFFLINVNYGFKIGDLLLNDFSGYLKETFKENHILWGRCNGDQFIMALFDTDFSGFLYFISNLIEKIKEYEFKKEETDRIKLTVSIGVSVYPFNGRNAEELLRKAAIALKSAKIEGRNTWKLFEPECEIRVRNVEKIKKLLEYGINEDKIVPYIQPIFDTRTHEVIGGEVLLRIMEKTGEVVDAGFFIEVAEHVGYVDNLEEVIFNKVIEEKFLKVFKGKYMFLNKSVRSVKKFLVLFENIEILNALSKKFNFYPVIEVTENSIVRFLDAFQLLNQELIDKSIKLAIDDFGAGYASFSFLLKINANFLKIDGALVKQLNNSQKHLAIIKGIIFLAKELKLKTIAEFVENEKEAKILKELGVDYFQGFFLSKLLSYEEFKKLVN